MATPDFRRIVRRAMRDSAWNSVGVMTALAVAVFALGVSLLPANTVAGVIAFFAGGCLAGLAVVGVMVALGPDDLHIDISHAGLRIEQVPSGIDDRDANVYRGVILRVVISNRSSENVSLRPTLHLALRINEDMPPVPGQCDLVAADGTVIDRDPFNIAAKTSAAGTLIFHNVFPPNPDIDRDETQLNRVIDREKSSVEFLDSISGQGVTLGLGRRSEGVKQ